MVYEHRLKTHMSYWTALFFICPGVMVLSSGSIQWFYPVVLSGGSIQWFYPVVLSWGSIRGFYPGVLSSGSIQWFYPVVLSSGSIQWFYPVVLSGGNVSTTSLSYSFPCCLIPLHRAIQRQYLHIT